MKQIDVDAYEVLKKEYQVVRDQAEIEWQQLMDQIELAKQGIGELPTHGQIKEVNALQSKERDVMNKICEFLLTMGVVPGEAPE